MIDWYVGNNANIRILKKKNTSKKLLDFVPIKDFNNVALTQNNAFNLESNQV